MIARSIGKSVARSITTVGTPAAGGAPPPALLLDTYTGAAAAYSLRRLRTAYTGPVVQVRRSGDSAEDTFTATEVSDGTLASWVTAGGGTEDGFVKTWYDQSGNANDASQATANNQPQIVASGAVVLENGEPTLDFDGSSDFLGNASIVVNQPSTYFLAYKYDNALDINSTDLVDGNSSRNLIDATTGNVHRIFSGVSFATTVPVTTNQEISYNLFNGASSEKAINGGIAAVGDAGTNKLNGLMIGASSAARLDGKLQELIIYPSNQTSSRTGIEANIASHYGITLA